MKLSKLIIVLQLLVLISTKAFSQNTAISDVTYTPAASAVLDVYSTSKGMLVPRMTETQKYSIVSPATGLLIYQTDGVTGFWYYDGIQWLQFFNSDTGWMTTGNGGIVDGVNFLGTTDDAPLTFKVSNTMAGRVSSMDPNTYFGFNAGINNLSVNGGTFIGYRAGQSNSSGQSNSAVGISALRDNTVGNNNTAIGFSSLMVNTTGVDNAALGTSALYSNTTGSQNTATGSNALYFNTTGNGNTACGENSLKNNTTGGYNSGVGVNSLYSCTTGQKNVAIGFQCLNNLTTANFNNGVGYNCLTNVTTGANNTGSGYQSLINLTTGANNTAIGFNAGSVIITGGNNTFIGSGADATATYTALTNVTAIGYNAKVTTNNSIVLGTTSNNVGIGIASPTKELSFDGTAARTIWMERTTTAGSNGNNLTLQAGGGVLSGTDKNGGDLNLSSGTSTGTGSSNINFKVFPAAAASASADNTQTTRMTINGNGIQVSGSVSVSSRNIIVAGAQTLTATDYIVINTTAGAATWTLPTASTGRMIIIVNHGTGIITTSPLFRQASTAPVGTIAAGSNAQLVYDGTEWRKVN